MSLKLPGHGLSHVPGIRGTSFRHLPCFHLAKVEIISQFTHIPSLFLTYFTPLSSHFEAMLVFICSFYGLLSHILVISHPL